MTCILDKVKVGVFHPIQQLGSYWDIHMMTGAGVIVHGSQINSEKICKLCFIQMRDL